MNRMFIIDGNSLLFRAYYATSYNNDAPLMMTKDGIPTNAIFAFANMMNNLLKELKEGDSIFVGFDTGKKTFRHLENEEYKANRKPAPKELITQMPIARDLLRSLNIFTFEKEGFEGDDICGTVAKKAKEKGMDVYIYTSDRDFLQLVEPSISVKLIRKGLKDIELMNEEAVFNKYGFTPDKITDYKGLVGDSSDNLPGIPGIGDKTATKLINEYGSLENIIDNASNIKGKLGENIAEYGEVGKRSKHLALIRLDIDLPFEIEATKYEGYNYEFVSEFANRYELKQFLMKLPSAFNKSKDSLDLNIEEVSSFKDINLKKDVGIALDFNEENYFRYLPYGLVITCEKDAYYISYENLKKDKYIKDILEDESIKKYGYNLKAIYVTLSKLGIDFKGAYFDIMIASYLLDSSLNNDPVNLFHFYGVDLNKKNIDSLSLFDEGDKEKASLVAFYSIHLKDRVYSELDKIEALTLYQEIEFPLIFVLAKMEIEGFPLDKNKLLTIGEKFRVKANETKKKVVEYAGYEINPDSPKQVGELLYDKLKLRNPKKGSTNVDVLKTLVNDHPVINEILTYRKYSKLCSTYIDGLISNLFEDDKLHCLFNQALTATGRLSSSDPNLQNISIKDEESKMIRDAFYYKDEDYSILSFDYSQIELRILALLSNSSTLLNVFNEGGDIHELTAKKIFHLDKVDNAHRRQAKTVNFGIIYGISDFGLAEELGVPIKEAKEIINNFYDAFPEVSNYFRGITEFASKNGYVSTLFNRRRYLKEVYDSSYQVREFARRAAMNAPIQGSAADLIKIAMIKVDEMLTKNKYKTTLVLQIHDELVFKLYDKEKDEVIPKIKEIMTNVIEEKIKLEVSMGLGKSWYELKEEK